MFIIFVFWFCRFSNFTFSAFLWFLCACATRVYAIALFSDNPSGHLLNCIFFLCCFHFSYVQCVVKQLLCLSLSVPQNDKTKSETTPKIYRWKNHLCGWTYNFSAFVGMQSEMGLFITSFRN